MFRAGVVICVHITFSGYCGVLARGCLASSPGVACRRAFRRGAVNRGPVPGVLTAGARAAASATGRAGPASGPAAGDQHLPHRPRRHHAAASRHPRSRVHGTTALPATGRDVLHKATS
jgi:hypothetical protein